MENCKISIEYLVQKFGKSPQGSYCLIEFSEKKMLDFHNVGYNSHLECFCKGIFVRGYDKSGSCFVTFLEEIYPEKISGKKNKAISFFMTCEAFNSFYEKLVLGDTESIAIMYGDPFKSNTILHYRNTYL